jgi:hypothetical protein
MRRVLAGLLLLSSGCALHQSGSWRLTRAGAGEVLVPPDVRKARLDRRTFTLPIEILRGCPSEVGIEIHGSKKRPRITVTRDELAHEPAGSLAAMGWRWESEGCVAPGNGMRMATAIAEALPLDPHTQFRLLFNDPRQSSAIDLDSRIRLRVVSPLLRDPKKGILEAPGLTGSDTSLTLTAKASDNLLGYETSVYVLRPKTGQPGNDIVPVSSERHLISTGANELLPKPSVDYFDFPSQAAFYRFFYESWRNDFSALMIAAATPAELDQLTANFEAKGAEASCKDLDLRMCVQIPKDVAVNPFVAITVNGAETLVSPGTTLRQIILAAKRSNPDSVLETLRVQRQWRDRTIPVLYDRGDLEILALPIQGGEIVSWR